MEALVAGLGLELDLLPLREGLEPIAVDGRVMNENVFSTIFGRNKTKAFSGIEPLNSTSTQDVLPSK